MSLPLNSSKVAFIVIDVEVESPEEPKEESVVAVLPTNESQLARVKYTGKGTEVECKICLVNYTEADTLVYLPCMHFYHEHCILDWFTRLQVKLISSTCPVCSESSFSYCVCLRLVVIAT
eukprot:TRINITY_DN4968_c0_g1_i11.p2 TRINITY_DN4968_c0_g1~~TRINITY_DN4968_c0_g1_i11.p2  ORF type:complete len:120 (-),score=25.35 TRINITY_DN4968_c0_g1_i11:160-519(-)